MYYVVFAVDVDLRLCAI